MPLQRIQAPKAGQLIRQNYLRRMTNAVMRRDNMAYGSNLLSIWNNSFTAYIAASGSGAGGAPALKLVRLKTDILPHFSSDIEESSLSSQSSEVQPHDPGEDNAVVLIFDLETNEWTDSEEEITVFDAYHLCYDKNSRQTVFLQRQSGRWVIIPQNTIRAVITVKDVTNHYPLQVQVPNTYAFRFVDLDYVQGSGDQLLQFSPKSPLDSPHGYVHNLIETVEGYLDEGTVVWAWWQQEKWYTMTSGQDLAVGTVGSQTAQCLDLAGNYTALAKDGGSLLHFRDTVDRILKLERPGTYGITQSWGAWVQNSGTARISVVPLFPSKIDGAASLSILPGMGVFIRVNASGDYCTERGRPRRGVIELPDAVGTHILTPTDDSKTLVYTGIGTITIIEPGTLPKGFRCVIKNQGEASQSLVTFKKLGGFVDYIPAGGSEVYSIPDDDDGGSKNFTEPGTPFAGVTFWFGNQLTLDHSHHFRNVVYRGSTDTTLNLFTPSVTEGPRFMCAVRNLGSTGKKLTLNAPDNVGIDNKQTRIIYPCQGILIYEDGKDWYTVPGAACLDTGTSAPTYPASTGMANYDYTNKIASVYNSSSGSGTDPDKKGWDVISAVVVRLTTGTVDSNGNYDGFLQVWDPATKTFKDGEAIWIRNVN